MSRKILIDATYPTEETRLVVCENGLVKDFEYQNAGKFSIAGNIYLAKVTKVEPSLQAVFVQYSEDSDGFLPIQEINPEYYNIPIADKEKIRESILKAAEENAISDGVPSPQEDEQEKSEYAFYKDYLIQEVIKVGQVMLVQIKKEGRGKKGAMLTTFISLPGRYCVFMPNAINFGGVSRKISDSSERQRLKKVLEEMRSKVGGNASVIIRTAGEQKTKAEIKMDFSYLLELWEKIRAQTLASKAPSAIYKTEDLIPKVIRDIYQNDIDEIIIQGHEAYQNALNFMQMIMPKHIHKIKEYNEITPIFTKFNVEKQLTKAYETNVSLKSGGYLVINQTEALVAIDVNSGRATRERGIEETALKTNIEAAHEISRQLRLRKLSGLIVIDFIDMESNKHNKSVENELKKSFASDKAKIKISKMDPLGTLTISRQWLSPSFLESNTIVCTHCQGNGRIRNLGASAVSVLRNIAAELADYQVGEIKVSTGVDLAFYLLNNKRKEILDLENISGSRIIIEVDNEAGYDSFFIQKIDCKSHTKAANSQSVQTYSALLSETQNAGESGVFTNVQQDAKAHENSKARKTKGRTRKRWHEEVDNSLDKLDATESAISSSNIIEADNQSKIVNNIITNPESDKKAQRRKKRIKNPEALKQDAIFTPRVASEESSLQEEQLDTSKILPEAAQEKSGNKQRRRNKKQDQHVNPATDSASSSDHRTIERQEINKSLLREIWNKIVKT